MNLRLDQRVPERGFRSTDEALDAFLGWCADSGFQLYPHQEAAILEIYAGNHVVLDAPTGSGKSLVAIGLLFKTFCDLGRGWYAAPIKALVSEKFFQLCAIFGPEHVGMMTGDATVNRDAPIIACTAEILSNLALREGSEAAVASAVLDEFHYYGDRDRGMAWQIPLLSLPQTTFLLMSGTLGDTTAIREDLAERTGRAVAEVAGATRPVPLTYSYSLVPIHVALDQLVRTGKAPVYAVHFTQAAAAEQAQALLSTELCTKDEKRAIQLVVGDVRFDSPFGPTLRRMLLHGVGLHHAGLLPRYRLLVEKLAQQGLLKIICGTDTLGVGINVPIRTVLFTQLCKFDGEKTEILKVRDFKQIAGRAGRAGYDTQGYVVVQAPEHTILNLAIDASKKKAVKAKPPTRGYKHWDEEIYRRLVERPPEPLESRFQVNHGLLLTLLQRADEVHRDAAMGYEALLHLIDTCHSTAARKLAMKEEAAAQLTHLEGVGILVQDNGVLRLDPNLPRDFSLHHGLSVFLLDALAQVPLESPTHALDVLLWVEAILENPMALLFKQVDRAKSQLMAQLKAAGVPYEERIAALEDISWPQPQAETIYAFFAAYAVKHPWVTREAIHPKCIAREMAESAQSFGEYVQDLSAARAEGVLLRYLSEVYKAVVQNVPPEHQTDDVLDVIAYLRALLARVDSSLIAEWEQMLAGNPAPGVEPDRPIDISADKKRFYARIRAELHAVVRALSRQDWEEAAAALRQDQGEPWSPDQLQKALQPFLDEHGAVAWDGRARQGNLTQIVADGRLVWKVRQRLLPIALPNADEEEDAVAWFVEGVVDLRTNTNPDGPLVALQRLGD